MSAAIQYQKEIENNLRKKFLLFGKQEACENTGKIFEQFIEVEYQYDQWAEISLKETEEYYYILCTNNLDREADFFLRRGLTYPEDWIDSFALQYYLKRYHKFEWQDEKKLLVAYGNCHIHDYYDCLNTDTTFVATYDSEYFKYMDYPRWKENRLEILLSCCDCFLYIRESFDQRFRNCMAYIRRNHLLCQCIGIPPYSFRGYFPQANPHIQQVSEFDIVQDVFNSFHREDIVINQLIHEQQKTDDEICELCMGRPFSDEAILENAMVAFAQIRMMDRVSDVKIYDYVLENYQKIRLFKDPVHLSDELILYITEQIMKLLSIQKKASAPTDRNTIHYFTVMPVYPQVAKTLKLSWGQKEKTGLRLQEGMLNVTFEEYVRRYLQFGRNVKEIKDSLHFDKTDTLLDIDVLFCE